MNAPTMSPPVMLEQPIERGEQRIPSVEVRRPLPAELLGLSLRDIVDMDAGAMLQLLPRCTVPPLLDSEVAVMHPSDFIALSAEASGFFLPKAVRPVSQPE